MINSKAVRVYIDDPRILTILVNILKSEGISFTELSTNNIIEGDIILTNNVSQIAKFIKGKHVHIVKVEKTDKEHMTSAIEKIKCLLKGKNQYKIVTLGIDPGGKIGLVILGDNELCKAIVLSNVKELIEEVKIALLHMPYEKVRIKIGNGERSAEVIQEVLKLIERYQDKQLKDKEILIELVDETRTYNIPATFKNKVRNIPKDVISALNIAIRKGLIVEGKGK